MDQIAQAFSSTAQGAPGAAQPITGQELLLRALGAIANPQRAISVPDTTLGRLSGLLSRGVGGIAQAKAGSLEDIRKDPFARKVALQQSAIEAFKAIPTTQQVPIQGGGGLLAQATPRGVKTLEPGPVTGTLPKPIRSVAGALRRGDAQALLGGGLPLLGALVGDPAKQFSLGPNETQFEIGPDGKARVLAKGLPKEDKARSLNIRDLQAFVSSEGAVRNATIPSDMTFEQGKKMLDDIQQGRVDVSAQQGAALADRKARITVRKQHARTKRAINEMGLVQDKLLANPSIAGLPGALATAITSVSDQLKGFAALIIPGIDFQALSNLEQYVNIFRETGIENPQLRSKLFGLAIYLAAAEGFEDRAVTTRKIELNLSRLGQAAGSGSAEIIFQTIEQLKQELIEGFNVTLQAELGTLPIGPIEIKPRTFGTSTSGPPAVPEPTIKLLRRRKGTGQ